MPHRLFVIISNRLRGPKYLSLADNDIDVLVIPEGLLSVEKEPADNTSLGDAWTIILKNTIVKRIRSHAEWEQSSVRIAGHVRTCFGAVQEQTWRRDRRFHEQEADLCEELGHSIDVQIWGFHHEPTLSHIWTVLRQVRKIWKDPNLELKANFLADLEGAFQRAQELFDNASRRDNKREKWETLSLAKHEIVGLFDPLRIRLETAREISREDLQRAEKIRAEVKESIELKLPRAQNLLGDCRGSVVGEQAIEWFGKASEQLKVKFDLSQFPEWLNQLDTYLHKLRNSVTE